MSTTQVRPIDWPVAFAEVARMVEWIAQAAREERVSAGVRQSRIAARADVDQSLIARFERGGTWPRDPDRVLSAYADELGLDVRELWRRGLDLWSNAD